MKQIELDFSSRPEAASAPLPAASHLAEISRDLLRQIGCDALARLVKIRWNSRMRTTAGLARYADSLITLNPKLAQFGFAEIDKTLRHELAHLVAKFRAGRRRIAPHGTEWRAACRDLGLPNEARCHDLPLPRTRRNPKHFYLCPSCRVSIQRVRPFRRRVACLACCRMHNRGHFDERFLLVKLRGET
jgi:SprT protein